MSWLHRFRLGGPRYPGPEESIEQGPGPVERAAPGIAALFEGLGRDGSHAVLDLGEAVESHLRLFSGFARQIRFAGLVPEPPRGAAWSAALRALPPNPQQPYDIVLAWNLLDRVGPQARPALVDRLDELTSTWARLHLVLDTSGAATTHPLRFTLLDLDHLSHQASGPTEPAPEPILPAPLERLLTPFEVVRAFTLRDGFREYVAAKGGAAAFSPGKP